MILTALPENLVPSLNQHLNITEKLLVKFMFEIEQLIIQFLFIFFFCHSEDPCHFQSLYTYEGYCVCPKRLYQKYLMGNDIKIKIITTSITL